MLVLVNIKWLWYVKTMCLEDRLIEYRIFVYLILIGNFYRKKISHFCQKAFTQDIKMEGEQDIGNRPNAIWTSVYS